MAAAIMAAVVRSIVGRRQGLRVRRGREVSAVRAKPSPCRLRRVHCSCNNMGRYFERPNKTVSSTVLGSRPLASIQGKRARFSVSVPPGRDPGARSQHRCPAVDWDGAT